MRTLALVALAAAACGPTPPPVTSAPAATPVASAAPAAAPSSVDPHVASGANPVVEGGRAVPSDAAPQPEPPAPSAPAVPPSVRVGDPSFVGGGEVPKVASFLERMKKKAADCVLAHDPGTRGEMRIQFLVSLRARAEGVDILKAGDFNDAAQKCVRDALKGGRVEVPTADPTGVQFTYTFE